jgi:hypothetical protein
MAAGMEDDRDEGGSFFSARSSFATFHAFAARSVTLAGTNGRSPCLPKTNCSPSRPVVSFSVVSCASSGATIGTTLSPAALFGPTSPATRSQERRSNEMPGLPWEELIPFTHPHDASLDVLWSTGSVQVGIVACVACTNSSAVEQDEDRT